MSVPNKLAGLKRAPRPEEWLVFGFLGIILLGTLLLALPASTKDGHSIGLFDSLFTATSAVCVTGLVAVDTGTTFSLFGQAVLLVLIQVGGLGFMVFATRVMLMLGRRISIKNRMLIRESMNGTSLSNLGSLARLYLLLAGTGFYLLGCTGVLSVGPVLHIDAIEKAETGWTITVSASAGETAIPLSDAINGTLKVRYAADLATGSWTDAVYTPTFTNGTATVTVTAEGAKFMKAAITR